MSRDSVGITILIEGLGFHRGESITEQVGSIMEKCVT